MNREQALLAALRFATAYVQKAVADGLMGDCAVPASVALERLRAVLGEQETEGLSFPPVRGTEER